MGTGTLAAVDIFVGSTLASMLLEREPHHPIIQQAEEAVAAIDQQREEVEGQIRLINSGWLDFFGEEIFEDLSLVGDIRRLARQLTTPGRLHQFATYLTSHEDPSAWSLRTLLHAIEEDQRELHPHKDTVDRIVSQMSSPAFLTVMAEQESGQVFQQSLQTIVDAYTNRTLLLANLYERMSSGVDPFGDIETPTDVDNEILYHASTNARTIFRHGFQEPQADRVGMTALYGSRPHSGLIDNEISFTSDLAIAHEIARSLREVIQIARGEITHETIEEWTANENLAQLTQPYSEDSSPYGVYKAYLDYLENSDRYNPVYLGDTRQMLRDLEDLEVDDVAILQCTVKLSDDVDYLRSLREFQVPVEAVLSVDRLIL